MSSAVPPPDELDLWSDGLEGRGDARNPEVAQGQRIRQRMLEDFDEEIAHIEGDRLLQLQQRVMAEVEHVDAEVWSGRPFWRRRAPVLPNRRAALITRWSAFGIFWGGALTSAVVCAIAASVLFKPHGESAVGPARRPDISGSRTQDGQPRNSDQQPHSPGQADSRILGATAPSYQTVAASNPAELARELSAVLIADGLAFDFDMSSEGPQVTMRLPTTTPAATHDWLKRHKIEIVDSGSYVLVFVKSLEHSSATGIAREPRPG